MVYILSSLVQEDKLFQRNLKYFHGIFVYNHNFPNETLVQNNLKEFLGENGYIKIPVRDFNLQKQAVIFLSRSKVIVMLRRI